MGIRDRLTTLALALVMPFAVAEETIDPAQLMEDVAGTYVPLFSVLNKPEYDLSLIHI